jgi:hypothetical protein
LEEAFNISEEPTASIFWVEVARVGIAWVHVGNRRKYISD